MELADVTDSKSVDGDIVWVRVPPPAPKEGTKKDAQAKSLDLSRLFGIFRASFSA